MSEPIDNDHLGPCGLRGYDGHELTRRVQQLEAVIQFLATREDGWPVIEQIGRMDIYGHITDVMPDDWEPDPLGRPVPAKPMTEAFIRMVQAAMTEEDWIGEVHKTGRLKNGGEQ